MKRKKTLQLLQEYKTSPLCQGMQGNLVDKFTNFTLAHSQCFERNTLPGHYTASCWLWNLEQTHVLFTHHKKLNKWIPLGGHADGNPNLLEVAIQEAKEESGIDAIIPISEEIYHLSIHHFPERGNQKEHLHYNVFFNLKVTSKEPFKVSSESIDLKWICPTQIEKYNQEACVGELKDKILATHS